MTPVDRQSELTTTIPQIPIETITGQVKSDIADYLGRYVYMLVDPRDRAPFYVGKGTGARVHRHGLDAELWAEADDSAESTNAKHERIHAIRATGKDLDVWILRRQMSSALNRVGFDGG